MRELYEKYLSEFEMLTFDEFEEFVNKLPIKYFDNFVSEVTFNDRSTVKEELMEAAIDPNLVYVTEVDDENMSVELEASSVVPSNALNTFHEVCDLLNSKGWTISNADEIESDLIELSKTDYRALLDNYVSNLNDEQIETLYKSIVHE